MKLKRNKGKRNIQKKISEEKKNIFQEVISDSFYSKYKHSSRFDRNSSI